MAIPKKNTNDSSNMCLAYPVSNPRKNSQVPATVKNVTVNLFFDGTGNNKFNIATNNKLQGEDSYFDDYSNIALLYDNGTPSANIWLYIDGIGTTRYKEDSTIGFALGTGETGVEARVASAFPKILFWIQKTYPRQPIGRITFNVFGFSRGAAAARHFVHVAKTETAKRFGNLALKPSNIAFKFIGLFDTVSSVTNLSTAEKASLSMGIVGAAAVGAEKLLKGLNNVDDLKLDFRSLSSADKMITRVLHIRAMDEYRLFFPCTGIRNAIDEGYGTEVLINGAHSDIGGSYLPLTTDSYEVIKDGKLHKWLIEEGYFKSEQFSVTADPRGEVTGRYVEGERIGIKNDIHCITLKMMRLVAEQKAGVHFDNAITAHEKADNFITTNMGHLPDTVSNACKKSWGRNLDLKFKKGMGTLMSLRNQYVHWSAQKKLGYEIRLENSIPQRNTYLV